MNPIGSSQAIGHDSAAALVINETLCHAIGFVQPRAAVGQTICVNDKPRAISGVMEDFNQGSVRRSIQPLYFEQDSAGGLRAIKAATANPVNGLRNL